CAPNTCESPSVGWMAKCSSSAILPCMTGIPRLNGHHAMSRCRLSAAARALQSHVRTTKPPGGRLAKRWFAETGGARGSRNPDLVNAIHALSQLSYGPSGNQESVLSNQQESKLVV